MRWLFACQSIDKGCKWWTETNNPFQYQFKRSIGLENKPEASKAKTQEEFHREWRKRAGLKEKVTQEEKEEAEAEFALL